MTGRLAPDARRPAARQALPAVTPVSATDASLLHLERRDLPLHLTTAMVFDRELRLDRLTERIGQVVEDLPRYRRRLRTLFLPPGRPAWLESPSFDAAAHVQEIGLPEPGDPDQLDELVSRLHARPLRRDLPLWDVHLVHGLAGGRSAVVVRTHLVLIDAAAGAVDLSQRLLADRRATARPAAPAPRAEPAAVRRPLGLGRTAVLTAHRLLGLGEVSLRTTVELARDPAAGAARAVRLAGAGASTVLTALTGPPVASPLRVRHSAGRLVVSVATPLDPYRQIARSSRARLAEAGWRTRVSVHGVLLTTLAGAFRSWLVERGVPVSASSRIRTLVPLAVTGDGGPEVVPALIDLPIGEPSPVMRLGQVSYQLRRSLEAVSRERAARGVRARNLVALAGFAPPTLHALGARVARDLAHRLFDLVVTDVPGPQRPLYLGAVRMAETFPVIPLAPGHAVAVGLTSYHGTVHFGLTADRGAVPDAGTLAESIPLAVDELSEALR